VNPARAAASRFLGGTPLLSAKTRSTLRHPAGRIRDAVHPARTLTLTLSFLLRRLGPDLVSVQAGNQMKAAEAQVEDGADSNSRDRGRDSSVTSHLETHFSWPRSIAPFTRSSS